MAALGVHELLDWSRDTFQGNIGELYRAFETFLQVSRIEPGFSIESDFFKITLCNFRDNSQYLQDIVFGCDWRGLMAAVLKAATEAEEVADIEQRVNTGILEFLSSPQGCLLALSSASSHYWHFTVALLYTRAHWDEATLGECTNTAVIAHVKESYNIDMTIPAVVVKLAEAGSWEPGSAARDEGRKRGLKIIIRSHRGAEIVAYFVLEKMRVNKSLKDLAAEAVARQLEYKGSIEQLNIPKTLKKNVADKFKDEQWVRKPIKED